MNARESAFLSLQKYENSGVYSNIELSYAIERGNLEGSEKSLYTALFYGVIEHFHIHAATIEGLPHPGMEGKLCDGISVKHFQQSGELLGIRQSQAGFDGNRHRRG